MGSTQLLAELAARALSRRQAIFDFTTWRLNTELNLHHHHHHHRRRRLRSHRIHKEMNPAYTKNLNVRTQFHSNLKQTTGGTGAYSEQSHPPHARSSPFEKLTVLQSLGKFIAFYGTERFITVSAKASHWVLFSAT